jgi:membrane-bound lytic murein transglycosylase B
MRDAIGLSPSRWIALAVAAALAVGCAPAPNASIPQRPRPFARALSLISADLDAQVRSWLASHPATGTRPPQQITLDALYQQRLYRFMRQRPRFAAQVITALPPAWRAVARDNYSAGRSLYELSPRKPPKTQPPIRIGTAAPPQQLLGWYQEAQRRTGVRWQVLAAINFVESGFNRLRNASYAGAQGPMQFMPSTWATYGQGDIHDPHAAILGAARFLRAAGAPASYRRAIYAYNPSPLYVDAITRYAHQMDNQPERFYEYWSWQIFVRGKRLTGPGR